MRALLLLAFALITTTVNGGIDQGFPSFFHSQELLHAIPAQTQATKSDDLTLIKRLVASYQRNAKKAKNSNSMWEVFFDTYQLPIHDMLLKGDVEIIAHILRNPSSSNIFFGFDSLASCAALDFQNSGIQEVYAKLCLDGLARLAEVTGAISMNRSEPYEADYLLKKIKQIVPKFSLFTNPYPHEHGVLSSQGIISFRVPQSLYQAWRLSKLLKGVKNPRVLEIGAGLGRTAFFARQLGIEDYTIVDLPFTAVSSGYFLGRVLGEDQILLFGEHAADEKSRIKIITPEEFLTSNDSYDLIFNADGLTEMDPHVAKSYWEHIQQTCPLFLSINHEQNAFTVKELIISSTKTYEVTRTDYWMRPGYFEETVRFEPQ